MLILRDACMPEADRSVQPAFCRLHMGAFERGRANINHNRDGCATF